MKKIILTKGQRNAPADDVLMDSISANQLRVTDAAKAVMKAMRFSDDDMTVPLGVPCCLELISPQVFDLKSYNAKFWHEVSNSQAYGYVSLKEGLLAIPELVAMGKTLEVVLSLAYDRLTVFVLRLGEAQPELDVVHQDTLSGQVTCLVRSIDALVS